MSYYNLLLINQVVFYLITLIQSISYNLFLINEVVFYLVTLIQTS